MQNPSSGPAKPVAVKPIDFRFECPRCGQGIINPQTKRCVACGQYFADEDDDRRSPWLMALGFFLPPLGLAIFLLLRERLPKKALSAAQGAIWSPLLYLLVVPYLANTGLFTPLIQAFTR
jgi:ribosomal protein L37E